ncbi:MAG: 2-hydroxychromene-2-carboxylate isomerase [Alphaproteobacteria bacterium]|nr:2-hydroxychromene-2-carboxylate isomerase [Alphaproteobacteria bacterium]
MARHADWYFDYVSPYAYLQLEAFHRLPTDLEVRLKPVLFAGLLGYWDNMGPAEIPAKRRQTYRYSHWLAHKRGIPFKAPPRHPFNPLAVLRLSIALDSDMEAIRTIFRHIWGTGQDGQDPESLRALAESLGVNDLEARIGDPAVKAQLRQNTDEATARGVFGIPTFAIDDELFWGDDLTDMMLDYLENPDLFKEGELARLAELPVAAERKESRL